MPGFLLLEILRQVLHLVLGEQRIKNVQQRAAIFFAQGMDVLEPFQQPGIIEP